MKKSKKKVPHSLFEEKEYNIMSWVGFWRANPHRFVEDYLGIHIFFFQKVLIYLMNYTSIFVFIAARGMGKTYLTAIFAVARCILYPGTKVVIAAPTKSQSKEVITKIKDLYNESEALRSEINSPRDIKEGVNNAGVDFKNGSTIRTVVAGDNARGARSHVLIVDEFRIVSSEVYNKILKPMGNVPRKPPFVTKYPHKYGDYSEDGIEILMTSAWYKSNWSWDRFKQGIKGVMGDYTSTMSVALPYQLSLLHRILQPKTVDDYLDNKANDEYSFMMEYQALFVGESENAFFTFDVLDKSRVLSKGFVPPTDLEYKENANRSVPKNLSNIPLQAGEVRLVSLDVALMGGDKNDTSAIIGIRLIPNSDGGYDRHLVYIDTIRDSTTNKDIGKIFKRAYYDFDATYAVLDAMGIGLGVYDVLAEPTYDEERDVEYEAWSSMNDKEMRKRYNDANAKQILYTVKASASLNSNIAFSLKSALNNGKVKLLVSDNERRDNLINNKEFPMDLEGRQRLLSSHQQTTALVNELISLNWSHGSGGNISISEESGGTKDRYTSLAYANYFADELELKNKRSRSKSTLNPKSLISSWK